MSFVLRFRRYPWGTTAQPVRIGALGAAAGIVLAMAFGQGVAMADPAGSDGSTSNESTSEGASPGPKEDPDTNSASGQSDSRTHSAPNFEPDSTVKDDAEDHGAESAALKDEPTGVPADATTDGANDAEDIPEAEPAPEPEPTVAPEPTVEPEPAIEPEPTDDASPVTVTPPPAKHDDPASAEPKHAELATLEADDDSPASESVLERSVARTTATSAELTAPEPVTNDAQLAALTAPVVPTVVVRPNPIQALFALPVAIITTVHNVVEAGLDLLLGPADDVPTDSPLLLGLLQWARRQINATFFNESPEAGLPETFGTAVTAGAIIGSIGVDDPEGDPLTYELVEGPAHGSVAFGPYGTYLYTPDADFAAAGGVDTFKVSVADTGWHLHLGEGTGSVVTTVTVAVAANSAPPQSGSEKSYEIVNLSKYPLKFLGYVNGELPQGASGPLPNQVKLPGESFAVKLPHGFLGETTVKLYFGYVTDTKTGAYQEAGLALLKVFPAGTQAVNCFGRGGNQCGPTVGQERDESSLDWAYDAPVVYFIDPPGTTDTVEATDPVAQGRLLKSVCGDQRWGQQCSFAVKPNTVPVHTKLISYVGTATPNNGPIGSPAIHTELTKSLTNELTTSTSLALKGELNILDIITLGIERTTTHSVTTSRSISQTWHNDVPPQQKGLWEYGQAVLRDTGDFTITIGHTTLTLANVTVDSPDPDHVDSLAPINVPLDDPRG